MDTPNTYTGGPDDRGHFGAFGGRYVAELLMPLLRAVEDAWLEARADAGFERELYDWLRDYVGRPTPLYHARSLTRRAGNGAQIYLKREDLDHTGAHKINACLGQALLARRMGKTRIIAETGAGQHGTATATVCALFDIPCTIYMGAKDMARQEPNVFRMRLLGAEVKPVERGHGTLKDALNEALRDWVTNVEDTYYLIGTAAGPHPYPAMVRDFQSVIGREVAEQMEAIDGRPPDSLVACIGGGSNAMGLFHPFLDRPEVKLVGVEGAGHGLDTDFHAAPLNAGRPGVLHGNRTYFLQSDDGMIHEAHSVSAGMDYPGVGPEHAWLKEAGRVTYESATDEAALEAFQVLTRTEGIIPALESAHAVAHALAVAGDLPADHRMVVNLSGRGDKDIATVRQALEGGGEA